MITIIAAMTPNRVIGNDGKLPWNIPEELNHFKEKTLNTTVIMGRRTYNSIGHALKDRNNIVLYSRMEPQDGIDICGTYDEAIKKAKSYNKQIFIIGGTRVYEEALKTVSHMIISHIKKEYPGDTYFPEWDVEEWKIIKESDYPEYTIREYTR